MEKTVIGSGIYMLDSIVVRDYPAWPSLRPFTERTVIEEVGGTCGNVMCILAWLGWKAMPEVSLDESPEGRKIASDLARLGVCKGSHVAICGRNSANWVYTFYAVQKLGAVAALINPGLKAAEIASVALGGDADFLCYGEILEMKDERVFLEKIEEASDGRLTRFYSIRSTLDFRTRQDEPVSYPLAPVRADDPALMIFTSGYTGTPKGVLLSSYGVLNASCGSAGNQRLTEADKICLILPMFHIFGLVAGLLAGACADATLYLPKDIRTDTILDLISREQCTVFHSVPSMLLALINNKSFTPEKLKSLRCTIISAAAATRAQMERFQAAMPNNHFLSSYGLSEMAPVSITEYEDTDEHVMFTVGKPWPDIRLKIVNRDTGEACPVGTDGEILVQGYSLMGGYYRIGLDDQAIDAEGWLHTGDRGLLDEEGYLRLLGRYKELILRGGENVMPGEIEYALTELDTVSNAKVIGVPSEFFGEEVCACVVCAPGKTFDEEAARRVRRISRLNRKWVFPVLRFVARFWPMGEKVTYSYGIPYNDVRRRSYLFPLRRDIFDGIEVSVPQNADPYLHDKFGDYMTLPNLDELHPHADNIEFYDDETSR